MKPAADSMESAAVAIILGRQVYFRDMPKADLKPRLSRDGKLEITERGWRLAILAGGSRSYRLSQLDDQAGRPRLAYPWQPPVRLRLRARASAISTPGTWGFGLWNDPYGFSFGPGEHFPRLPTLPQAAWFFAASPRCYLSFRDDKPAQGFYAQVFRSQGFRPRLLEAALALPFAPKTSRKLLSSVILEEAAAVGPDPCQWHSYGIEWDSRRCLFSVDEVGILETPLSPRGPLGSSSGPTTSTRPSIPVVGLVGVWRPISSNNGWRSRT